MRIGKTDVAVILARLFTLVYFAFFLLMPWYSRIDKTKPEPERVTRMKGACELRFAERLEPMRAVLLSVSAAPARCGARQ